MWKIWINSVENRTGRRPLDPGEGGFVGSPLTDGIPRPAADESEDALVRGSVGTSRPPRINRTCTPDPVHPQRRRGEVTVTDRYGPVALANLQLEDCFCECSFLAGRLQTPPAC
jgi:hypothetical protein